MGLGITVGIRKRLGGRMRGLMIILRGRVAHGRMVLLAGRVAHHREVGSKRGVEVLLPAAVGPVERELRELSAVT
jgi:hypothetical protein